MLAAAEWKRLVAPYEQPNRWRALWQLGTAVGSYALLWYLMYLSLAVSWWLTAPLAVLTGLLLIRVFIVSHDCGHGSFFGSRLANDAVGWLTGLLTLMPYYHWRWQHAQHHGTAGDLDRRGRGDVWTMTVQEYLAASPLQRFAYRLSRNPLVLFVLAPVFVFVIKQRFAEPKAGRRERLSVWLTNLGILAMAAALSAVFGLWNYLLIQLIVTTVGGAAGILLFYVQHQFEGTYWAREKEWDFTAAALQGSSYFRLPAVLRWLSGNIGYHHIHHLSTRIANYNLKRCHDSHASLQPSQPVTLLDSLKALRLHLWDERLSKLVGIRRTRDRPRQDQH